MNNWGGTADITAASAELTAALTTLRSQAQAFGSNLSTVQIRQEFTKAMINTLQSGADGLTLADRSGLAECVLFPDAYRANVQATRGQVVHAEGRVDESLGAVTLAVERVRALVE